MKYVYLTLVTSLLAVGVYFGFKWWSTKPSPIPKIEETAIIVEDVKEISQLFTTSYYTEFTRYLERAKRFLVLVAKGTVYAGINLECLDSSDVTVINYANGDRHCTIILPPAEILDAIINPSGFEIFVDEGRFNYADVQALKQDAVSHLRQRGIDAQITKRAEIRVINIFSEYLTSMGFTSHQICFE